MKRFFWLSAEAENTQNQHTHTPVKSDPLSEKATAIY